MDNLSYFGRSEYEADMFGYNSEEEHKVHTPYVLTQDYSSESCSNIKPINQKIEFSLSDLVIVKKAKSRKTKTIEDPNSNKKKGHWSCQENKRYHWFLELHHEHFFNKHLRRTDRIFKSMATFVQTRQAEQCRSHHQKMEKKFKQFSRILMSLRLQNYNIDDHELILADIEQRGCPFEENSILTTSQLSEKHLNSQNQQNSEQNNSNRSPIKISKFQPTSTSLPSIQTHFDLQIEEQNKQQQAQPFNDMFEVKDSVDIMFNDTFQNNIHFTAFY